MKKKNTQHKVFSRNMNKKKRKDGEKEGLECKHIPWGYLVVLLTTKARQLWKKKEKESPVCLRFGSSSSSKLLNPS